MAFGIFFVYYAVIRNYQTRLIYIISIMINLGALGLIVYNRYRLKTL